jgi:hypothetical protein
MEIGDAITAFVDGWCERRALPPLRVLLPHWPPPNGFTDEWQEVWAALRHIRALCRDDLVQHSEYEALNSVVAGLSKNLFPHGSAS